MGYRIRLVLMGMLALVTVCSFTFMSVSQSAVVTAQDANAPTNTPEPTFTPSRTPLPPIADGALRATVVRASVLITRDVPSLGGNVVKRIQRGETYAVVGRNPEATWYLLELGDVRGWAWGYYLYVDGNEFNAEVASPFTTAGEPASGADVVAQATSALRLRAQPDVNSAQIGRVPWGGFLAVTGRSERGSWYRVVWRGTEGWVFAPYTNITQGDINSVPFVGAAPLLPAADPAYDVNVQPQQPAPQDLSFPTPTIFPTANFFGG